jgi:hypothetical protein
MTKIINSVNPNRAKEYKRQLENIYKSVHGKSSFDIFQTHKIPYFYAKFSPYRLQGINTQFVVTILNPILENYKFVKLFDPFTAFQEISMFISGVLGTNENETVEVDEKYRMAACGIDKTSFRQSSPGNKKERRKSNKLYKRQKRNENKIRNRKR